MSKQNLEQVSAFMDDELNAVQSQRLLNAMKRDAQLCRFWHSGQAISAALHGESMAGSDLNLAQRVHDALESEPVVLAPAPVRRRSGLGPLGGVALAASVAMLAIIATQQALLTRQASKPQGVAVIAPGAIVSTDQPTDFKNASSQTRNSAPILQRGGEAADTELTRMTWNDAGPGVEERLNGYLLNHNEYMARGLHGMLPYARVVGYGQNK